MPAQDRDLPIVIAALRKQGWRVADDPALTMRVGTRALYADIIATKASASDHPVVVLEVKGFRRKSAVAELEQAIGQYVVYRTLLEERRSEIPIYLAVPQSAYDGIWSEQLGMILQRKLGIKMFVYDQDTAEVVQWKD